MFDGYYLLTGIFFCLILIIMDSFDIELTPTFTHVDLDKMQTK